MPPDFERSPLDVESTVPPQAQVVAVSIPQSAAQSVSPQSHQARQGTGTRTKIIASLLFLATCCSTWVSGAFFFAPPGSFDWGARIADGLWYAAPVMLILLCHEMGHYLTARWHRVPASPPFFLPFPLSPLGTLGAVIVQPRGFGDRRTMFDIAVAGPLAGFIVAVPVAWFGVQRAEVQQFLPENGAMVFGDPLLLKAMVWLKFGTLPELHDVQLNPLLFAGWAGLFLTGLNLVPIGQLDGGHIMYALIGRRAHLVAQFMLLLAVGYMAYFGEAVYMLMVLLLLMTGIRHPPTMNDHVSLGIGRNLLGWGTMLLFFLCFTPFPMTQILPEAQPSPANPVVPEEAAPRPAEDLMVHQQTEVSQRGFTEWGSP